MEMGFLIPWEGDDDTSSFIEAHSIMNRFRALMDRGSSIHSLRQASSQGREQMNPHTEGRGFDSRTIASASSGFPAAILSIYPLTSCPRGQAC
jgi:hypothetical protein